MKGKIKFLTVTALTTLMIGCSAIKPGAKPEMDISKINPASTRVVDFGDGPVELTGPNPAYVNAVVKNANLPFKEDIYSKTEKEDGTKVSTTTYADGTVEMFNMREEDEEVYFSANTIMTSEFDYKGLCSSPETLKLVGDKYLVDEVSYKRLLDALASEVNELERTTTRKVTTEGNTTIDFITETAVGNTRLGGVSGYSPNLVSSVCERADTDENRIVTSYELKEDAQVQFKQRSPRD